MRCCAGHAGCAATTSSVAGSCGSSGAPSTTRSARSHGRSAARNGRSSASHSCQNASCAGLAAVAGEAAVPGDGAVGLHPDQCVEERGQVAASDPDALDDDQRAPGRHGDRTRPPALVPLGRAERDARAAAQRRQHALGDQRGPVEHRVVPGDVVGVHDGRARHPRHDPFRDGRLPLPLRPSTARSSGPPVTASRTSPRTSPTTSPRTSPTRRRAGGRAGRRRCAGPATGRSGARRRAGARVAVCRVGARRTGHQGVGRRLAFGSSGRTVPNGSPGGRDPPGGRSSPVGSTQRGHPERRERRRAGRTAGHELAVDSDRDSAGGEHRRGVEPENVPAKASQVGLAA